MSNPICYRYTYEPRGYKSKTGCIPTSDLKHVNIEATKKAHEYERELSRQLLKDLMTQRGIRYDENEAKLQSLWSHHGKYAVPLFYQIPKLCDALRKDWYPDLTDEQIRENKEARENIKAKILKDQSEQLQYMVISPEEVVQSCWPDWLK